MFSSAGPGLTCSGAYDPVDESEARVIIIGGGATGVGVLRDLSMRGVKATLLERGGLASGTSSRFHGLLHCGGRYAVSDPEAARECIEENAVLRRIGGACVEGAEGFFVLTDQDDPEYARAWLTGCARAGIRTEQLAAREALRLEPRLTPALREVYRTPDAGVDGFRLVWHNSASARRYGGVIKTYHQVTAIETRGGRVTGVRARDLRSGQEHLLPCDFVVNAAGPWAGEVAALAGLRVHVLPDRGSLLVFNHRFVSRVINRLHPSSDGDIFVPLGTVTILGTTSAPASGPDDTTPRPAEVLRLLELGGALFPQIASFRILRAFAGNRPLYAPPDSAPGRGVSRNFALVDHEAEGLAGLAGIFGGKLTTYRLMAEKAADLVCAKLGVRTPCRTDKEPLLPAQPPSLLRKAARHFPLSGVKAAAERAGALFPLLAERLAQGDGTELLCECEMVSRAEVEIAAADENVRFLHDLRFRTRMGMGTCQGAFCSLRSIGALAAAGLLPEGEPVAALRSFFQERWRGLRPALWGAQLREIELGRAIYAGILNFDGIDDEAC